MAIDWLSLDRFQKLADFLIVAGVAGMFAVFGWTMYRYFVGVGAFSTKRSEKAARLMNGDERDR